MHYLHDVTCHFRFVNLRKTHVSSPEAVYLCLALAMDACEYVRLQKTRHRLLLRACVTELGAVPRT
jgi:hypothetical protein